MRRMNGFSLMEMMVVLLITAIVAAASAPMINKKLMHNQAEATSPWIYTSNANSIAYNIKNSPDMSVSIGAIKPPELYNWEKPALYIESKKGEHIRLDDSESDATTPMSQPEAYTGSVAATLRYSKGTISFSDYSSSKAINSVIIGRDAFLNTNSSNKTNLVSIGHSAHAHGYSVALGAFANTNGMYSTAIGAASQAASQAVAIGSGRSNSDYFRSANALADSSVAIGPGAYVPQNEDVNSSAAIAIGSSTKAEAFSSVSLGCLSKTTGENSIAIGYTSEATAKNAIAIGGQLRDSGNNIKPTQALHENSVAIGAGATTTAKNQIVLGDANTTVYIPGNLVVDKYSILGYKSGKWAHIRMWEQNNWQDGGKLVRIRYNRVGEDEGSNLEFGKKYDGLIPGFPSDRRLKNVSKAFTGGLEEVKKLELFNYTYKKDPEKTPHVGVMAQDLEKIFPNAVFKGDDGFLRIRMEDMFYAMVNAIKELDNKLNLLEQKQKKIDELEARLDKLEKRLEKLEKLEKKAKKD